MTEPTKLRPPAELALIARAYPIVLELLEPMKGSGEKFSEEFVATLDDRQALALLANMFGNDLLRTRHNYGEGPQICGWCIEADGNDNAARDRAKIYTLAEVRAHTLECEHNPLVKVLAGLEQVAGRLAVERAEIKATLTGSVVADIYRNEVLELRALAGDLLAVIHGDGGHYQEAVGIVQAFTDAEARVVRERSESRERIVELERGLAEALTLLDEVTEDTPDRVHAIRCREIKAALLP